MKTLNNGLTNLSQKETVQMDYVPTRVRIAKRVFDLSLASILFVLTLPLWPLIMLAIKLSSKGPVLFQQQRIGVADANKFNLFTMLKFRTMVADAEAKSGPVWASKNDPRITTVGRFLRKTRLDELPQLINVLKGEMSMIGPRPERAGIMARLEHEIPMFNERMYGVLPGITGLAQVYQGYDETIEDSRNKLGYDLAYAVSMANLKDWFLMDIHVALKTVSVVIMGRGQ
ncbi:Sugar transferase involved in LPS biosynthesis (colanic, teichoic acid) [Oceanospirillum multiglobuliferum]|nr:sugar transferase [Oceanospirillum multiglobuliferum]SJZ94674.1 Sugar transferase involved in LPS biosynthesis (colanic, teichoic acid) [Oceanospirillum multiglobuliferum]